MFYSNTRSSFADSACRGAWPETECQGKATYPSKAAAISRIRHQSKRGFRCEKGFRKAAVMSPYRCPHCKQWHVGATVPSKGKRK
jgi:hypothetical protein